MLTYAQNFEDVMLERLFREMASGFYVDVGAWDPTVHSVTRHFYDRGWRGVNIEPIARLIDTFKKERPRDVNLCVAVGPRSGAAIFYECEEEGYLSTLDREVAEGMRARGLTVHESRIEMLTLDGIFARHCPESVDFLKIDVEGFEGELLKGLDLSCFRPRALVIEATRPATAPSGWEHFHEIGTWQEWEPALLASGYVLAHFDGLNRFYLRQEDAGLAKRLELPPGMYDAIELPVVRTLRAELAAVEDDRAAKAEAMTRLAAELAAVEDDRASKAEAMTRLAAELAAVEDDRVAKAEATTRLATELAAVEDDRAAKAEATTRLATELAAVEDDRAAKAEAMTRLAAELAAVEDDRAAKAEATTRLATELAAVEDDRAAKAEAMARLAAELAALRAELERQAVRIRCAFTRLQRKHEVLARATGEIVGYRSALGGALEVVYRRRRQPGALWSGGRLIASASVNTIAGRRVAMDVMSIQFGVSGGVEIYMRTLVQALLRTKGVGIVLLCLKSQVATLRKTFGDEVAYLVFKSRPAMRAAAKIGSLVRRKPIAETIDRVPASFAHLHEEIGAQILHCPVQLYSLLDFNIPAVLHLHDLQHLHFPENFSEGDLQARTYFYGRSADLSNAIIVTSDFVRNDIIARMGVSPEKVVCIPATWDPKVEAGLTTFSPEDARRTYNLPELFGLFPAQFWLHKNHARLVEALGIVRDRLTDRDFKLVFTGNRAHSGWPKVAETIERLSLGDHVKCLDYVPVEHLAALYKCAAFCVMPSTFEASSYPVIEAQLLGCPAMCSNVTSLPELVRDGAGLLFNPFDVDDMADKMLHWLRHPDDAAAHAARASQKVRREHGMDAYATSIAAVYQRIAPL